MEWMAAESRTHLAIRRRSISYRQFLRGKLEPDGRELSKRKPDAFRVHVVVNAYGQEKATQPPGHHYPFITDRLREIGRPVSFNNQQRFIGPVITAAHLTRGFSLRKHHTTSSSTWLFPRLRC